MKETENVEDLILQDTWEKGHHIQYWINKKTNKKEQLIFVGDGINDAPVLTRADVGIAMGAMGSDAAIEAADVVVMDDKPYKVAGAIKLSRKTMRTVWQNVFFALGIKLAIMVVCALGFGSMWMAVFGDVGVTLLSVLHSMGLLWSKKI